MKTVFRPALQGPSHRSWPGSSRTLMNRIARTVGTFWDRVTYTHTIDLKEFQLPGCKSVKFRFQDPLFVWIQRCNSLAADRKPLHWRPQQLLHPTVDVEGYGAGVQYGLLFRSAYRQIPRGGTLALVNISWDGGQIGFGSRSAVPILVQVMNTNSSSPKGAGLVGYLPSLEVAEGFKDDVRCVRASKFLLQVLFCLYTCNFVRTRTSRIRTTTCVYKLVVCLFTTQACVGLILKRVEAHAENGFWCLIGERSRRLFPRVGAMTLDTIERVKYFGLRNVSACGICRKRWGRSATRRATEHDPAQVASLYETANATSRLQGRRKRAREQLKRHGFDYTKRCRVEEQAPRSLIKVDKFGPRPFGGLCRYERMHVYYQNFCNYCIEAIIPCVKKEHYGYVHQVVLACQQFRDPISGKTHPRLPFLLKMTHMTAERRVRAIFYWAHVLGSRICIT